MENRIVHFKDCRCRLAVDVAQLVAQLVQDVDDLHVSMSILDCGFT